MTKKIPLNLLAVVALMCASCASTDRSITYRVKCDFNNFTVCGHDIYLSAHDVLMLKSAVATAFPAKEISSITVLSRRTVYVYLRESAKHCDKYRFIKRKNSWMQDNVFFSGGLWY